MRRSSVVVIQWACNNVAVIWGGARKRRPKILFRWWRVQGYLAGNVGLRIMPVTEIWFIFVASEGSKMARMQGMPGL